MRHAFLEIGKIVSTHGVKGEVRVDPWCDEPAFVMKIFPYSCYLTLVLGNFKLLRPRTQEFLW